MRSVVFLALTALLALPALAQGTGTLAGRITDAATGETLPGANVRLEGTSWGAATDVDGVYRVTGVPVGTYAVAVSYAGFQTQTVEGVQIANGQTARLDVALGSHELGSVEVVYERPLIQRDAIGAPRVSSPDRPSRSARRQAQRAAAAQGGVVNTDPAVPLPALRSQEALLGTVPAHYGDTQSGGVAIQPGVVSADPHRRWGDREQYAPIEEVGFRRPTDTPLSTFSIDVDRASYANVRRMLTDGHLPPPDAVRVEEFVNAFDYGLTAPGAQDTHPVRVETETAVCPWAPDHRLLRIALQARRVEMADLPPVNLVFLLDVSGSMGSADKLPLVQQAMRLLVGALRPQDRVAIVVYAGASGLVLPPTAGSDRRTILRALDRLQAGGSTAGGAGLRLAYDVARQHFDARAVNRVILATDGDFNVGASSDAEMLRLVEQERESGVLLSVLGVGTGNLQDAKMERLADHGNGAYAYLDSIREAERVLVREVGGTLVALAKDVKLQVEFNPAAVAGYRLLGYENRALAAEDFVDDRRDAGELGAGHSVTALYEIVPAGHPAPPETPGVDPLRYQRPTQLTEAAAAGEIATVSIRYKPSTDGGTFAEESVPFGVAVASGPASPVEAASEAMRWATAVVEAGLLLRRTEHAPGATYEQALALAQGARGADPHGDRAEFIRLVETARALTNAQASLVRPTALQD